MDLAPYMDNKGRDGEDLTLGQRAAVRYLIRLGVKAKTLEGLFLKNPHAIRRAKNNERTKNAKEGRCNRDDKAKDDEVRLRDYDIRHGESKAGFISRIEALAADKQAARILTNAKKKAADPDAPTPGLTTKSDKFRPKRTKDSSTATTKHAPKAPAKPDVPPASTTKPEAPRDTKRGDNAEAHDSSSREDDEVFAPRRRTRTSKRISYAENSSSELDDDLPRRPAKRGLSSEDFPWSESEERPSPTKKTKADNAAPPLKSSRQTTSDLSTDYPILPGNDQSQDLSAPSDPKAAPIPESSSRAREASKSSGPLLGHGSQGLPPSAFLAWLQSLDKRGTLTKHVGILETLGLQSMEQISGLAHMNPIAQDRVKKDATQLGMRSIEWSLLLDGLERLRARASSWVPNRSPADLNVWLQTLREPLHRHVQIINALGIEDIQHVIELAAWARRSKDNVLDDAKHRGLKSFEVASLLEGLEELESSSA